MKKKRRPRPYIVTDAEIKAIDAVHRDLRKLELDSERIRVMEYMLLRFQIAYGLVRK